MIKTSNRLAGQLITLIVITFAVIIVVIGIVVPSFTSPIYDETIYHNLEQSLRVAHEDIEENKIVSEIAFVYIVKQKIYQSDNLADVVDISKLPEIIKEIKEEYGKFNLNGNTYYYFTIKDDNILRIAITNDRYISKTKKEIFLNTIPIILITYTIVSLIIFAWSNRLVKAIETLKQKLDRIDDSSYDHSLKIKDDNELRSLENAIEDMRVSLKNQEEFRNQMYQNISHDFKTPLAVIKSYVEAVEDGALIEEEAFKVILEQTNKLESKVKSLLYLNKLDYLKGTTEIVTKIKVKKLIEESVEKFKYERKDVKITINVDKNTEIIGTVDIWETIIDNILNNFLRYADKEIKITAKNNRIVLYNDGPNIDLNFIESMFVPFRKGVKGEFGLGLSIVKKTLNLIGFDIEVKNHPKKGVSFIIAKEK